MEKPELLSPAGSWERLEAAVRYGADAVYLGGDRFGLRAACGNFGGEALPKAVAYAHGQGVRVYLTCNTLPTCDEADGLPAFLRQAAAAGVDALIVSDVGVLRLARELVPQIPVHISTQAGVVNHLTARALYELGASRVVLARELSLEEIGKLRARTPPQLELEAFVHGAMCMSFSGRCLLSQYLNGRDANRGDCSQPCRWRYRLVEEKRPGQYLPIGEEEGGSYILNAKDLCMLEHLRELWQAGVSSFKIEGRAKSAYYVAAVTNAYRAAMDAEGGEPPPWALEEVGKVSHRAYDTGFYFGRPGQYPQQGGYIRRWEVAAVAEAWQEGLLTVTQRNRFFAGETLELMLPGQAPRELPVQAVYDPQLGRVDDARHPMGRYMLPCPFLVEPGWMLRKRISPTEL